MLRSIRTPAMMMYERVFKQNLIDAKEAHIKWVRRAKHLVENLPLSEDMIPVDSTECSFGCWFHKEASRLKVLRGFEELVEEIDALHTKLHDIYIRIYKIYFVDTKRSWLLKAILGEKKEVPAHKQEEAQHHFLELEGVSSKLIKKIEQLERALLSVRREEFGAIFG